MGKNGVKYPRDTGLAASPKTQPNRSHASSSSTTTTTTPNERHPRTHTTLQTHNSHHPLPSTSIHLHPHPHPAPSPTSSPTPHNAHEAPGTKNPQQRSENGACARKTNDDEEKGSEGGQEKSSE